MILAKNMLEIFSINIYLIKNGPPLSINQQKMSVYVNKTMMYIFTFTINKTEKSILPTIMSEFLFILESLLLSVYNGLTYDIQC